MGLGRGRRALRLLAAGTAVLLITGILVPSALAGDTRDVYIGDPGGDASGSLTYTATRPGGYAAVDIEVRNDGGQTLNHASLVGGYAADMAPENPLYPKPGSPSTPPSLDAALTYVAAFAPAGVTCEIGPDGDLNPGRSLVCDLGSFPALTAKVVRVVVSTPAGAEGSYDTWYGAYFSEGNQTGTNQDNFYATGTVTTATAACTTDDNTDANYFLPGSFVSLASANCAGTGTEGSLASRNALDALGRGGFGSLSVVGPIPAADCPVGYTCYGDALEADVLGGGTVPGGLQWTMTWWGIRSVAGVIHYWDSYIAGDTDTDGAGPDEANGDDYTVIPFTKKFQCSAKLTTNCWTSTASSKGNETPAWFRATFITSTNGKGGGFV